MRRDMGRNRALLLVLAGLLLLPQGRPALAQTADADVPGVDATTRVMIRNRLDQFTVSMNQICNACTARLPVSSDMQITDGYLRMLDYRLHTLEQNLDALGIRWNIYYPTMQYEISQDEELMDGVQSFELMIQEATDSLAVRRQQLQALRDFIEARSFMTGLDSTYNGIGKRAFELSLTPKTATQLEKEKNKEGLLFASVQEKFDKAQEADRMHLVSAAHMEELKDLYAALQHKSETIQAMVYKPLLQRLKDYLLGLAAVAMLLMFINMVNAKIKAAKQVRQNMKQYQDAMKLNGKDDYPTL